MERSRPPLDPESRHVEASAPRARPFGECHQASSHSESFKGLRPEVLKGYRLGQGFICTPFPDRSAHRSSRESEPGWDPSVAKTPS